MHEGIIVKSLFDIAEKSRKQANLKEVHKVRVVIGKFHQIVKEVLLMYFDLMKKEIEGFENATLELEEKDLMIRCKECKQVTEIKEPLFTCPECSSINTEVVQGNELYIDSLKGID